jgi:hypothetical protein
VSNARIESQARQFLDALDGAQCVPLPSASAARPEHRRGLRRGRPPARPAHRARRATGGLEDRLHPTAACGRVTASTPDAWPLAPGQRWSTRLSDTRLAPLALTIEL